MIDRCSTHTHTDTQARTRAHTYTHKKHPFEPKYPICLNIAFLSHLTASSRQHIHIHIQFNLSQMFLSLMPLSSHSFYSETGKDRDTDERIVRDVSCIFYSDIRQGLLHCSDYLCNLSRCIVMLQSAVTTLFHKDEWDGQLFHVSIPTSNWRSDQYGFNVSEGRLHCVKLSYLFPVETACRP